jgi:hypothetical protein
MEERFFAIILKMDEPYLDDVIANLLASFEFVLKVSSFSLSTNGLTSLAAFN